MGKGLFGLTGEGTVQYIGKSRQQERGWTYGHYHQEQRKSTPSLFFIQSKIRFVNSSCPQLRKIFISVNLIEIIPQWYAQRLIFQGMLDSVKVVISTNYHRRLDTSAERLNKEEKKDSEDSRDVGQTPSMY